MNHRAIAVGASLILLAAGLAGRAEARNPNCAGGIQYVVQGMRDKEKQNLEDYKREMLKAIDRLSICSTEDSTDYEALAYLGWAYAELDSACPAGQVFQKAIEGLRAHDPKKVSWAESNRESYWAKNFNQGVADIQTAQSSYPEFTKEPADETEKSLKATAEAKYQSALGALERASCLKPGDPRTVRNLGTVYALMGDLVKAEAVLRAGLVAAPGDTDLVSALGLVRRNYAGKLIDQKQYGQAIAFYSDLLKTSPNDADLHTGLADAYFKQADSHEGDAKKADYKAAGDEYAKSAQLRPGEADLHFNAALSYQNATEWASAENEWREFLKIKPQDTDGMSALGSTLAEEKKLDEAAAVLHQALLLNPKEKKLHMQLGGVYSRADNQPKSYEEMVVYIALSRGTTADNPGDAAKRNPAGSDAAKVLAAQGAPEQLQFWEAEGQKYETWFYWSKNLAYTFRVGQQVAKSDWAAPPPKLSAPAPAAPSRTVGRKR